MGLAVETLGFRVANPSSTFTAVTMAAGNSNVVRQFTQGTKASLEHIARQGATAGSWRILSSSLHDNVRGITYKFAETPSTLVLPDYVGEPLQSGDTLTIQGTGGTNETEVGSITVYYQDVLGLAAKLYMWEDIAGAIEHVKPLEVDVSIGGTAGNWTDQLFTTTDGQQKADRKYAVLGWVTDTALCAVAVYGGETGNVRMGGPGPTSGLSTSHWFIDESKRMGTPHIPVISANNFGSTYVSTLTTATSGTAVVSLTLALLRDGFA
jgi:hypothetical protein